MTAQFSFTVILAKLEHYWLHYHFWLQNPTSRTCFQSGFLVWHYNAFVTWTTAILFFMASLITNLIVFLFKFDSILSTLCDLHWLSVIYRVRFEFLLLVYKAPNNQASDYIHDDFVHVKTNTIYCMCSQDHNHLANPRAKDMAFGDRAFVYTRPFLFKRPLEIIPTLTVFMSK